MRRQTRKDLEEIRRQIHKLAEQLSEFGIESTAELKTHNANIAELKNVSQRRANITRQLEREQDGFISASACLSEALEYLDID